ncbi:MAG: efflux RND transporter periplasmic adaptor subunit, partial [Chloroflexi bacterium]|nr:efflux RND transporter periplasmic adaptor subunit [Chloroflexota bacterium]
MAEIKKRLLEAGARPEEIAVAAARVREAQAALASAQAQAAVAQQQIAIQSAQVEQAQAQYDLIKAGARPEDLELARAHVAQAEAALQQAKAALNRALIVAPFKGTVCEMNLRLGEQAVPGMPVISLGDLTTLRVETTDLDEIDAARIKEGQAVQVTFDALPDVRLPGKVERLALKAGAGGGGVVYKAI